MQNLSELAKLLLKNRNVPEEEWEAFLKPDYNLHVHDPYLIKDMDKAVLRFLKAVEDNEKIGIFSDYDADGVPGAVMMKDFLDRIKYDNVVYYIPDRHLEGFGLNEDGINYFEKEGVKLLITIDCGITDVAEVDHANKLKMDVIISDHHLPGAKLPKAFAILDSKQEGDEYPFKELCGTGVAFKFIQAILLKNRFDVKEGEEKWLLDMVGIATLSDMVPLVGENRVFAYFGLKVLRMSRRPGLVALFRKAKIDQTKIVEDDVGFTIAPRINAASRMGHAMDAFTLLSTKDEKVAKEKADELEALNTERKSIVARMAKEMKSHMTPERIERCKKNGIIVIGDPKWKPSLLGLAANSLVEEHDLPVFLWGREGGDVIKGSCRSNGKVNIVEVMRACEPDIFIDFGGHVMSGGFALEEEKVHSFEEALARGYLREKDVCDISTALKNDVDTTITFGEVNGKVFDEISRLAPFGEGNRKPIFNLKSVLIKEVSHFGKEKNHLKIVITNGSKNIEAIAFFKNMNSFDTKFKNGDKISMNAFIEKDFFKYGAIRLRIQDIF